MHTTSAFAARQASVCGLDCAFTVDESLGASVSSLYTFPLPGLARRWHGGVPPAAFADFTEVLRRDFSRRDPF